MTTLRLAQGRRPGFAAVDVVAFVVPHRREVRVASVSGGIVRGLRPHFIDGSPRFGVLDDSGSRGGIICRIWCSSRSFPGFHGFRVVDVVHARIGIHPLSLGVAVQQAMDVGGATAVTNALLFLQETVHIVSVK